MTSNTLFQRAATTLIAIMMAGSVAALDVVCCGNGPVDPNPGFGGPTDLAPNPGPGPQQPEEDDHADNGNDDGGDAGLPPQTVALSQCSDMGGQRLIVRRFEYVCQSGDGDVLGRIR